MRICFGMCDFPENRMLNISFFLEFFIFCYLFIFEIWLYAKCYRRYLFSVHNCMCVCLYLLSVASFGIDCFFLIFGQISWSSKKWCMTRFSCMRWCYCCCCCCRCFRFKLMVNIEAGAFSFPTSASIWVKVHQDLMKSACTAY